MEIDYNEQHWKQKSCPKYDCRKESCKCGLKKVIIPTALGDDSKDSSVAPKNGAYCNALVVYEANGHIYIYSTEGIPTLLDPEGEAPTDVYTKEEINALLQQKQNLLTFDTVPTLNSTNPVTSGGIKNYVDTHMTTYQPYPASVNTSGTTQEFMNSVLALDAPVGTAFLGTVSLSDLPGSLVQEEVETYVYNSYTIWCFLRSADTAPYMWWCCSYNYQGWKPMDTTYSDFTGTDGDTAGTSGLVPAPATTDAGKFLKADGTWDTAGGGGPTVVQTTGNSQTDVMSQDATTKLVYVDSNLNKINIRGTTGIDDSTGAGAIDIGSASFARGEGSVSIGKGSQIYSNGTYSVAIGNSAAANNNSRAVALGNAAEASNNNSVAIGTNAKTTRVGEVNVGANDSGRGYNNTNYRVIGGVHDGQTDNDAVNLSQLNGRVKTNAGAPTTSTVGTVGQLLEDTTNGKLYQCTAVSGSTYTWTEVGAGGGGGPTVVQSPGTSTTNVMSQDATSEIIYGEGVPYGKIAMINVSANEKVSPSSGQYNAIGSNSVLISSNWTYSAAGDNVLIGGGSGGTLGPSNQSVGSNLTFAVALGSNAANDYSGSVSLGAYSKTRAIGDVNIGSSYAPYGYNNTNYRILSGVHDGQELHDAATVAQGNTLATVAPDTSTVGVLGQLWTDTTNMHTYQCTAISGSTYTWTMRW